MKLIINYDLIEKIKEAKTGISLVKSGKRVLLKSSLSEIFCLLVNLNNPIENILKYSLLAFYIYIVTYSMFEIPYKKSNKIKALEEIKRLVIQLKDLNISTNKELLMDSYVYEKEHKLVNKEDSILPEIKQSKYINVPVYNDGEIKEVSLVQEHIIGSKYYVISYGEPTKQKVFRPAFGSI